MNKFNTNSKIIVGTCQILSISTYHKQRPYRSSTLSECHLTPTSLSVKCSQTLLLWLTWNLSAVWLALPDVHSHLRSSISLASRHLPCRRSVSRMFPCSESHVVVLIFLLVRRLACRPLLFLKWTSFTPRGRFANIRYYGAMMLSYS